MGSMKITQTTSDMEMVHEGMVIPMYVLDLNYLKRLRVLPSMMVIVVGFLVWKIVILTQHWFQNLKLSSLLYFFYEIQNV